MRKSAIKLLSIGGSVNREVGAALGGRAMSEVAGMRPDLLLLGVCSIHANEELGAFDAGDAEMLIQRLSRKFRLSILLVWRATIQLKACMLILSLRIPS